MARVFFPLSVWYNICWQDFFLWHWHLWQISWSIRHSSLFTTSVSAEEKSLVRKYYTYHIVFHPGRLKRLFILPGWNSLWYPTLRVDTATNRNMTEWGLVWYKRSSLFARSFSDEERMFYNIDIWTKQSFPEYDGWQYNWPLF